MTRMLPPGFDNIYLCWSKSWIFTKSNIQLTKVGHITYADDFLNWKWESEFFSSDVCCQYEAQELLVAIVPHFEDWAACLYFTC